MMYVWSLPVVPAFVLARPDAVFGYVGPAGIGALGVLVVVAAVLLIGAVGLVLHPFRLILRRRRRFRQEKDYASQDTVSPQIPKETT